MVQIVERSDGSRAVQSTVLIDESIYHRVKAYNRRHPDKKIVVSSVASAAVAARLAEVETGGG